MNLKRALLMTLATAALLTAGCGGGDDDDGDANGDIAASGTTAKAPSSGGGLPDPCKVFSSADLGAAFGTQPGAGTVTGGGSRKVCQYAPGAGGIGVSEANQYDGSVSGATANGSTCTAVAGVGDKATFCNAYGQVGSLFWVDGDVMYDLTANSVDQAKFTALAAKANT